MVVLTTGAMRRAKLQSNHHREQTNTQFSYRSDLEYWLLKRVFVVAACVQVAVTMYVRYRQVGEYLLTSSSRRADRVNKASLVSGLVASLSTTLVANFPVCNHVRAPVLYLEFITSTLC